MIWWRDAPDGRELKIALDESEWLVFVEADDRAYRARDLRVALAEAVDGETTAPWVVALADQVETAAPPSLFGSG
jgi:hypothetical protein